MTINHGGFLSKNQRKIRAATSNDPATKILDTKGVFKNRTFNLRPHFYSSTFPY
jgi:hypothetical protein